MLLLSRGLAALLAAAAVLQLVATSHIIYDETVWTKRGWEEYKIEPSSWNSLNPADDAVKVPGALEALKKTERNSLDGPLPRRPPSATPLCVCGVGARCRGWRCTPRPLRCMCFAARRRCQQPPAARHAPCS